MGKMMVMQSLAWAAAIIVVALLGGPPMAPILLGALGTLALGRLRLDAEAAAKLGSWVILKRSSRALQPVPSGSTAPW